MANNLSDCCYAPLVTDSIDERRYCPSCGGYEKVEKPVEDPSDVLRQIAELSQGAEGMRGDAAITHLVVIYRLASQALKEK